MGIPRWFTEGLSVYEEDARNPRRDPQLVALWNSTGFVSFTTFDRQFMGPYVNGAYQLASYAVEFMNDTFGWSNVLSAIAAYQAVPFDPTLPARALGVSTNALDRMFVNYVTNTVLPHIYITQAGQTNRYDELRNQYTVLVAGTNIPAARAVAQEMGRLYPGNPEGWMRLAECQHRLTNRPGMIAALSKAAVVDVDDASLALRLANELSTNEPARAATLYRRAFHIDPFNPELYPAWAGIYADQPARACAILERGLIIAPHDWRMHLKFAQTCLKLKRLDDAWSHADQAAYYEPDNKDILSLQTHLRKIMHKE